MLELLEVPRNSWNIDSKRSVQSKVDNVSLPSFQNLHLSTCVFEPPRFFKYSFLELNFKTISLDCNFTRTDTHIKTYFLK